MSDHRKSRIEAARHLILRHPEWYHSIELLPGVYTPGRTSPAELSAELEQLRLPDLAGKSVLDIGSYDGYFAFEAERLGAARVVALDHYVWCTDMVGYMTAWRSATAAGRTMPPPHESEYWRPETLPGQLPFAAVRSFLESKVQPVVGDFMNMDSVDFGRFDVVLFLGVLYHLETPLPAIRNLYELTAPGGMAIIETEATEVPALGARAMCEFFPGDELGKDASNWWVPNAAAVVGMCRSAGFQRAEVLPRRRSTTAARRVVRGARRALAATRLFSVPDRYRLVVHAFRE